MKPPKFKDLILFENDDYIVVNKPPFLATLDERIGVAPSLLRLAREYADDAQVGHRLDRDTSGSLVLAKNPEAYRHISMQFENREVHKIYHAVTWGAPPLEQFVVERNIETTKSGKARLAFKGKPAETRFTTLEVYAKHALVRCEPVTGTRFACTWRMCRRPSWATRSTVGRISTCHRSRRNSTLKKAKPSSLSLSASRCTLWSSVLQALMARQSR
jgi:hypothetical protein